MLFVPFQKLLYLIRGAFSMGVEKAPFVFAYLLPMTDQSRNLTEQAKSNISPRLCVIMGVGIKIWKLRDEGGSDVRSMEEIKSGVKRVMLFGLMGIVVLTVIDHIPILERKRRWSVTWNASPVAFCISGKKNAGAKKHRK